MHDGKAVSLAIATPNAFGRSANDGIDDVCWTFNGTETVQQTLSEGVDYTSIRHLWLKPFIERRSGRFRIAIDLAAVFREGEGRV